MKPSAYTLLLTLTLAVCPMVGFAEQTCNDRVAASAPNSRFTVNADNTVTDHATQLMWQRCSIGQSGKDCGNGSVTYMQWNQALKVAEEDSFAGYNDWRLPNIKELTSIIERSCYKPAMNLSIFPNTPTAGLYWSSSPFAFSNFNVWIAYTEFGYDYEANKRDYDLVRLVRDTP